MSLSVFPSPRVSSLPPCLSALLPVSLTSFFPVPLSPSHPRLHHSVISLLTFLFIATFIPYLLLILSCLPILCRLFLLYTSYLPLFLPSRPLISSFSLFSSLQHHVKLFIVLSLLAFLHLHFYVPHLSQLLFLSSLFWSCLYSVPHSSSSIF